MSRIARLVSVGALVVLAGCESPTALPVETAVTPPVVKPALVLWKIEWTDVSKNMIFHVAGESRQLKPAFWGTNQKLVEVNPTEVVWESNLPEIASIENGVVRAHRSGVAIVTVRAGGQQSVLRVFVREPTSLSVEAFMNGCPTREEVLWVDAIGLVLNWGDDPYRGQFQCRAADGSMDLSPLQAHTYQALLGLALFQPREELFWTRGNKSLLEAFATNGLRSLNYTDTLTVSLGGPDTKIALGLPGMWFAMPNWGNYPGGVTAAAIRYMALLLHEGRHVIRGHNCVSPTNAQAGFDSNFAYGGAYAVDWDFRRVVMTDLVGSFKPDFRSNPGALSALQNDLVALRNKFCDENGKPPMFLVSP